MILIRQQLARTRLWRAIRDSERMRSALGFRHTIWTRKVADDSVRALVRPLRPEMLDTLEVSGSVWEGEGFRSYRKTSYPAFDITTSVLPEAFDLVIMEHILEHLRHPGRALDNALAMVRPGGHLLLVTPFLYKVHPDPIDCHRWTETGLRNLLEDHGIPPENTVTGSWGNRACIRATMKREFIHYNRYLHSLANEPDYPVVVWALARRPAEV